MIVLSLFKKKIREKPKLKKSGLVSFKEQTNDNKKEIKIKLYLIKKKIIHFSLTLINKLLRSLRISSFIWK